MQQAASTKHARILVESFLLGMGAWLVPTLVVALLSDGLYGLGGSDLVNTVSYWTVMLLEFAAGWWAASTGEANGMTWTPAVAGLAGVVGTTLFLEGVLLGYNLLLMDIMYIEYIAAWFLMGCVAIAYRREYDQRV